MCIRDRDELGPNYDIKKHFTPTYKPWDQRMCLVPDSDLFRAIKKNKVSIVTDTIKLSKKITDTEKIRQITVSEMLAETLRRIDNKESVSSLFVE